MSSRWRECLASAGLRYGGLGGPRQCVRRSQRASLAPRRSILPLSASFHLDQTPKKSNQLGFRRAAALLLDEVLRFRPKGAPS
jgi:hypothetical protein